METEIDAEPKTSIGMFGEYRAHMRRNKTVIFPVTLLITDRFSGPGRAIGSLSVRVSVCVRTITFEEYNL